MASTLFRLPIYPFASQRVLYPFDLPSHSFLFSFYQKNSATTNPRRHLRVHAARTIDTRLLAASTDTSSTAEDLASIPTPVVIIDQHSEENATVLELQFGDRLGALLDTTKALKELGLNVVRAKLTTEGPVGKNRFVIKRSDNGGRVEDASMLEAIRMTVISNLLQYHPESSERLALNSIQGFPVPRKQLPAVETRVTVESLPDGKRSVLSIEAADRPGLINEIVDVLTGLSINVVSAEIDTEGVVAKDQFYVSYHEQALNKSMKEVVSNSLVYFLTHPEVEAEDSY